MTDGLKQPDKDVAQQMDMRKEEQMPPRVEMFMIAPVDSKLQIWRYRPATVAMAE